MEIVELGGLKATAGGVVADEVVSGAGFTSMSVVSILTLLTCSMDPGAATPFIPGYGLPRVFRIVHATTVPSLAYAYITGDGGSFISSPEAVL